MGATDSKVGLRSAILTLKQQAVPADNDFWSTTWAHAAQVNANDTFEALLLDDIREVLRKHPRNVECIIKMGAQLITDGIEDPTTEKIAFLTAAIRIFSRVFPVVNEREFDPFANALLWNDFAAWEGHVQALQTASIEALLARATAAEKLARQSFSVRRLPIHATAATATADDTKDESTASEIETTPSEAEVEPSPSHTAQDSMPSVLSPIGEDKAHEMTDSPARKPHVPSATEEDDTTATAGAPTGDFDYGYRPFGGDDMLGKQIAKLLVRCAFIPGYTITASAYQAWVRSRQDEVNTARLATGDPAIIASTTLSSPAPAPPVNMSPHATTATTQSTGTNSPAGVETATPEAPASPAAAATTETVAAPAGDTPSTAAVEQAAATSTATDAATTSTAPTTDAAPAAAVAAPAGATGCAATGGAAGSHEMKTEEVRELENLMAEPSAPGIAPASIHPILLWHEGLGYSEDAIPSSSTLDANRVDYLRCLVAVLSRAMYLDVNTTELCRFNAAIVDPEIPLLGDLVYSLLNTVVSYDPVGWGVPYGSSFVSDAPEQCMISALEALLLLADYMPTNAQVAGRQVPVNNLAWGLLAGISAPSDFAILGKAICTLLGHVYRADNTYLPYSMRQVGSKSAGGNVSLMDPQISCHQSLLILLWKLCVHNKAFMTFLVADEALVHGIVTPILYYMYQARLKPERVGLFHVCTFLILLLSGHSRDFALALNHPLKESLPVDLPLTRATYADLLVLTIHKVIVSSVADIHPLFGSLLIVLTNVAAYIRTFNMAASSKLMHMLEMFSSPSFLFRHAENHVYLERLLYILNTLIQYQYTGHANFVYCCVRKADVVRRLFDLQLPADAAPRCPTCGGVVNESGTICTNCHATRDARIEQAAHDAQRAGAAVGGTTTEVPIAPSGPGSSGGGSSGAPSAPPPEHKASEAKEEQHTSPAAPKFVPTQEWFHSWHLVLPIRPLYNLVNYLEPRLAKFCASGSVGDDAVVQFIESDTVVGVLPVPHLIVMHHYTPDDFSRAWFSKLLWGIVFMRYAEWSMFDSRLVRIFSLIMIPATE